MQSIFLTGNLTADCEVQKAKDGSEYIRFTVAVNDSKTASQDEKPTFYSCRMKRTGAAELLKKGRFVAVTGNLKVNVNQKEDKTYVNLDVWVNIIDIAPIAKEG